MKKSLILIIAAFFLTACTNYNVKVNLTPEEKRAVQAEVQALQKEIKNYVSKEGELPNEQIINLANGYEKLGELKKAIDVYTGYLDKGYKTFVMINNVGRLYEQVGEYDVAVEQYQRIINEWNKEDYLYDITWAYIRAAKAEKGDNAIAYRKKAEQAFNAWQMALKTTDEQTQQEIKKLREKEKNNL